MNNHYLTYIYRSTLIEDLLTSMPEAKTIWLQIWIWDQVTYEDLVSKIYSYFFDMQIRMCLFVFIYIYMTNAELKCLFCLYEWFQLCLWPTNVNINLVIWKRMIYFFWCIFILLLCIWAWSWVVQVFFCQKSAMSM